jgi:hypothetical protein
MHLYSGGVAQDCVVELGTRTEKAIPNALGNRDCAGLRGAAGRTRTAEQAIM